MVKMDSTNEFDDGYVRVRNEDDQFLKRVEMMSHPERSDIQNFYTGKTVFVTGASGYIGKLLVEKILFNCDIKKMYILLRSKKDKMATTRFIEIFDNPIFVPLKAKKPDFLKKVSTIIGDCNLPYLGIMEDDQEIIKNEVNIIFHAAATVRFDENLKIAANINVRAVRDLIRIAKDMKHLESLLHVSTAYSNCTRKDIDETFYEPPITSDQLLSVTESLDEKMVQDITLPLLGKWPNTYAFTKALGENVIETYGQDLPIGIIRPSIVIATNTAPVPGYIDNLYGATGILVGAAVGLIRVLHCKGTNLADIIPADVVVNTAIAASVDAHKKHAARNETKSHENQTKQNIPIYNCVSSPQKPIDWDTYMVLANKYGREMPSPLCLWHYFFFLTNSKFIYDMTNLVLHKIPAYIVDFGATCIGKKPLLVKGYRKIDKFSMVISFFSTRQWEFHNRNTQILWREMTIKDKKNFDFNMGGFSWEDYFPKYMAGCRLYLLKDKPETIPEGKKKILKLQIIHYAVVTLIFVGLYKLICSIVAMFVL